MKTLGWFEIAGCALLGGAGVYFYRKHAQGSSAKTSAVPALASKSVVTQKTILSAPTADDISRIRAGDIVTVHISDTDPTAEFSLNAPGAAEVMADMMLAAVRGQTTRLLVSSADEKRIVGRMQEPPMLNVDVFPSAVTQIEKALA